MTPRLSIVVVVHDMPREAPRTLLSLSSRYQRGVAPGEYEVIVVENASPRMLGEAAVAQFGSSFRYLAAPAPGGSPARALNAGVRACATPALGLMIDGARMVTPGAVALALRCLELYPRAVIGTAGMHLGPDQQQRSAAHGYNRETEDGLLESVGWPADGDRLWEIGAPSGSSGAGLTAPLAESCLLFMARTLFDELGGYDERFGSPGGGLVNLDLYRRASELPDIEWITLIGEATFHQLHGGVTTSTPESGLPELLGSFHGEYETLRGEPYAIPQRPALFVGHVSPPARRWYGSRAESGLPDGRRSRVRAVIRRQLRAP